MMMMMVDGNDLELFDDDYKLFSLSLASSSYWLVTRNYTPVGDIYTHTNPPGRNGLISIANNDASDIGK